MTWGDARSVCCITAIWLVPLLAGCQFCPLGEPLMCTVDAIADHEPNLDGLYHPACDLTRIGMPDWCECRLSRLKCPHACPDVPRGREPYRALINSVPRGCRVPPDVYSSATHAVMVPGGFEDAETLEGDTADPGIGEPELTGPELMESDFKMPVMVN